MAWAPHRDPETASPDYTCVIVADEQVEGGVRVVQVADGTPGG